MSRTLTVATEVQKAVFTQVLLGEIATGFWKNARPADHADSWKNVEITVGSELGAVGFDVPRNYNFVNPDFFRKAEDKLMNAAKTVNPDITVKQLKKQLISLNQILGARLNTIHNLFYYQQLMTEIRAAIEAGDYAGFQSRFRAERARGLE